MPRIDHSTILSSLKADLLRQEDASLSPLATLSRDGISRIGEQRSDEMRLPFALDVDRILHSRAYTRYIDKTQVFSLVENDHITHRVLHVQLVSRIARTMGRFLGLNPDLIEAVALGHDIGHPPFGHDGERFLAELCGEYGLPVFQHNIQSVHYLDRIERRGRGWNLTLQTMDGILCHDGEVHNQRLIPARDKDFAAFDREIREKSVNPAQPLVPMTLEGCVVRFADTIGYIGRDIEDAIELGLIRRDEIPQSCRQLLGETNGAIVYSLVTDFVANSRLLEKGVGLSPEVSGELVRLKRFNYDRIYLNPAIKRGQERVRNCYQALFATFVADVEKNRRDSVIFTEFLDTLDPSYLDDHGAAAMARDFIAGMTDDYFLAQAARMGCSVPVKTEKLMAS